MAMSQSQAYWTLEMVHALPDDGNRYELVDGELLVSPSPSLLHQRVLRGLYDALMPYVNSLGDHETLFAPTGITFTPQRELQPDLLVLPFFDGRPVNRFADIGRLLLAVEVLSPSTARNDRSTKRVVYQQQSVPEYWLMDPDARLVERWRPGDAGPEVLLTALSWQPFPQHAPLDIDLVRLFGEASGE